MPWANTTDDIVTHLKRMPRQTLPPQAEERIVSQLRLAAKKSEKRSNRTRRLHRMIGISVVIGLFVLIPLLWDTPVNQWLGAFGQSEEPWKVSPTFDLLNQDGSIVYPDRVVGVEGKIGFLEPYDLIANAPEPVAKMFWYVWGNQDELIGKVLKATAVHQGTGEQIVLDESTLGEPVYGEDASALTSFNPFPLKGQWRIDVFIDGNFYESIFVHVKDEYIQTGSVKFHVSRDDATVGKTDTTLVVKGDKNDDMIEVKATPIENTKEPTRFKFYRDDQRLSTDGGTETLYHGSLNFDAPGKWRLEVLDEITSVDVKPADGR